MSENEKVYCGNGRVIKTQYGDLMKLSFSEDDLKRLTENMNNGWVNAVVKERRNPSETGLTHYMEIDTWKPEAKEGGSAPKEKASAADNDASLDDEISPEDLPF